jgi:hypothetical protein
MATGDRVVRRLTVVAENRTENFSLWPDVNFCLIRAHFKTNPGTAMYAAIRHYKFEAKFGPDIDKGVKKTFLPLLKKIPGFVAYYWVDTGIGEGASISVFKSKKGADASINAAAEFVRLHPIPGMAPPEIVEGPVKANG